MNPRLPVLLLAALAWPAQTPPNGAPTQPVEIPGWRLCGDAQRNKWQQGTASLDPANPHKLLVASGGEDLVNAGGHGCDLRTQQSWGDARIEIDLMVAEGQSSAIYVMGEYAVQVLDSYGKPTVGQGDLGGLYGARGPRVNASKPPGEWQKLVLEFEAPRFDAAGKMTAKPRFLKIELNGTVIQENVTLAAPTPGGLTGKDVAAGPILLQGSHGIVAYRRLRVEPLR